MDVMDHDHPISIPPGFPKGPRRSSGATKANPMGRATRRSSASSAQDPWREMDGSMSHGCTRSMGWWATFFKSWSTNKWIKWACNTQALRNWGSNQHECKECKQLTTTGFNPRMGWYTGRGRQGPSVVPPSDFDVYLYAPSLKEEDLHWRKRTSTICWCTPQPGLEIETKDGQWIADNLVQVGLVRIERPKATAKHIKMHSNAVDCFHWLVSITLNTGLHRYSYAMIVSSYDTPHIFLPSIQVKRLEGFPIMDSKLFQISDIKQPSNNPFNRATTSKHPLRSRLLHLSPGRVSAKFCPGNAQRSAQVRTNGRESVQPHFWQIWTVASLRKSMNISKLRMIFRVKNGQFGKLWMVYPFKNGRFLMAMWNLQLTGDSPPIIVFLWKLLSLQHKKLPAGPVAVQILGSRQRLTFVHHAVQNRKLPWGRHSGLLRKGWRRLKLWGCKPLKRPWPGTFHGHPQLFWPSWCQGFDVPSSGETHHAMTAMACHDPPNTGHVHVLNPKKKVPKSNLWLFGSQVKLPTAVLCSELLGILLDPRARHAESSVKPKSNSISRCRSKIDCSLSKRSLSKISVSCGKWWKMGMGWCRLPRLGRRSIGISWYRGSEIVWRKKEFIGIHDTSRIWYDVILCGSNHSRECMCMSLWFSVFVSSMAVDGRHFKHTCMHILYVFQSKPPPPTPKKTQTNKYQQKLKNIGS